MKVIRGLPTPPLSPYPVLSIGNFDGLHVGHHALLTAVVETAAKAGGTPTVLTFQPHPVQILKPDLDFQFLATPEQKLRWFQNVGIQEVVVLDFTHEFAGLTPEQFMERILQKGLGIHSLFVGQHFVFGKGRQGTIADLMKYGKHAQFQVHTVSPFRVDGEVVSSTRIRQMIQRGRVREASHYLGRCYSLAGTVIEGRQRGQGLGYRTANFPPPANRVIPADGVYVTLTWVDEKPYESISYIGVRPTFGEKERMIEVHFLDQALPLYGKTIDVGFLEHIRGDQTFDTIEDLKVRMDIDVGLARQTFNALPKFIKDHHMGSPIKSEISP